MTLAAGTRLGPYELLAQIGSGGMGEIYRARDPRLGREIAIKVLPERLARDPEALSRFEREARAVASLSHPNILAIHDFGVEGGVCYSVTELLAGETLRDRLREGPLAPEPAAGLALQVAQGLAAAHDRGIVHRDLKPENIFLTRDGLVKILDFGLARVASATGREEATASGDSTQVRGTQPGTLLGTVGYMSPEQVRGQDADARSDLFSFGCVLYEMSTGRRAFARPTAAETLAAILNEEPPGIRRGKTLLPAGLRRIAAHCLEKDPADRFQSARDLAYDLKCLAAGGRAASRSRGARRPVIRSLAILPFENAGGNPESEYLADGLTEGLINSLAPIPRLRVRARSTVERYRDRSGEPREAGRQLEVDAVVAGRVNVRGESLSVHVELVDCADGSQLWGERFQRNVSEVFALQEDVVRRLFEKLRGKPAAGGRQPRPARPAGSAKAYRLYLEGRYHWNKRTEEGFRKGIEFFEATLREDARYAPALAGLSDCYSFLAGYGHLRPQEGYPRAEEAARRALEIDPSLGEAHDSLAIVLHRYDWDWPSAEREFRKALRINPRDVTAHHWYGLFLLSMGRFEEAEAQVRRARDLDPMALVVRQDSGYLHFCRRRFDGAIDEYGKILELEPGFAAARLDLGLSCAMAGRFEEGLAEIRRAISETGARPRSTALLAYVLALAGRRDEARGLLAELAGAGHRPYVPRFSLALVQVGLGEFDDAFRWLEEAYSEREDALVSLKVNPRIDPLRKDARLRDLQRRVGFA